MKKFVRIKKKTTPKQKQFYLLTPQEEDFYKDRKAIVAKMGKLKKSMEKLKANRDSMDKELKPVFTSHKNVVKLSDGTIVHRKLIAVEDRICTKDMVGKLLQAGFTYPHYEEFSE